MFISYKNLKMAGRILKTSRLTSNVHNFRQKQNFFNCWNFTAFTLGWTKKLKWFSSKTMEKLLINNSYRISNKKLKAGDIVVYRNYYSLDHTALILDPKKKTIIHKDGYKPIELNNYKKLYNDSEILFRRPKKQVKMIQS